jgi:hypothetical protein
MKYDCMEQELKADCCSDSWDMKGLTKSPTRGHLDDVDD